MLHLPFAFLLTFLPVATPTPPLAINVNVQPSFMDPYLLLTRQTPYTYTCSVLVFDAESRKGLLNARTIVERGKSETQKKTNGEYSVEFTVKINVAGDHAETQVVVQRNGAIVGEQSSNTALMKPPVVGGR
jgi:hypothetical protein